MTAHKAGPPACSGKRARPGPTYLPLAAFDDAALASDVALLQAVQDAAVQARRGVGPGAAPASTTAPTPADGRPSVRLRRLEAEARRRRVTLRLQPAGMSRRTRNSTRYDRRTRALAWHVEWRVVRKEGEGPTTLRSVDSKAVPEGDTLSAVLARDVLGKAEGELSALLAPYAAELEAGTLLLRLAAAGRRDRAAPAWLPLDPAASLGSALAGRTVDEFPTIAVVLAADTDACPV